MEGGRCREEGGGGGKENFRLKEQTVHRILGQKYWIKRGIYSSNGSRNPFI